MLASVALGIARSRALPISFTARFRTLGCALLVLLLATSAGCARRARPPALPPLELAASPEPRAEAAFREAQRARSEGRNKEAARQFRSFMKAWPADPLVPFAKLELGRLELEARRPTEAQRWFDDVAAASDPALAERGRMYAAIAKQRLGQNAEALPVLRPLVGRTVDPIETALLLGSVAEAEEATGNDLGALEVRDRELGSELSDAQRAHAEERANALVRGLEPESELPKAYEQLPREGYAWPMVARQLLRVSFERGERERVSDIAEELADRGITLDEELSALVLRAERSDAADPMVIGAILPLSGRGREVGEAALHGLLLSASDPSRPRVVYRDDGGDPARAVAALEDLVSLHRAIAIIGPLTAGPAQAVVQRANELGVPVLALHPDASLTERSAVAYRMLAEPREEADALVRAAKKRGAKRFALVHPENAFGQTMRDAFAQRIEAQGGQLAGAISYAATTASFVREAEALEKLSFDTLVLCDGPGKIALMAPALAAKGLWSVAPGTEPPEGRRVLYVVPAAGFSPSLANSARRYLQGALFAVPFDPSDAPSFAGAYREKFQSEPNLFSALGNDAYRLLERTLASGISTREALTGALVHAGLDDPAATGAGFAESRGPEEPFRLKIMVDGSFVLGD